MNCSTRSDSRTGLTRHPRKEETKGDSNGDRHSTQAVRISTRPDHREKNPAAAGAFRRRAAGRENGPGEHAPIAEGATGRGGRIAEPERRPYWNPTGHSLRVDSHRPVRARRRPAVAHAAA